MRDIYGRYMREVFLGVHVGYISGRDTRDIFLPRLLFRQDKRELV